MHSTMLCYCTISLLVAAVDGTGIEEWTFTKNHQPSNFSLSVLQEKPRISRIQCIVECSQSKGCFTLEYKQSRSICTKYRLFRDEDGKALPASSAPVVHSYTMNDPRGQHHGETCSCHVDCVDDRTQCIDNTCTCQAGYSLNLKDGSCVEDPRSLHLGETCSSDAECVDDKTKCIDSVCTCMTGYSLKHGDPPCTKDSKGRHYGKRCSITSDCIDDRTQCVYRECRCQTGYSYNSKDRSCIEECDSYGRSFSLLTYQYCSHGFNDEVHRELSLPDFKRCSGKCRQTESFTCRSFELWNGTCYLFNDTRLAVPKKDWREYDNCKHYQRNCA